MALVGVSCVLFPAVNWGSLCCEIVKLKYIQNNDDREQSRFALIAASILLSTVLCHLYSIVCDLMEFLILDF